MSILQSSALSTALLNDSPSEWVTRMGASVKSESITDKFIYDSLLVGFNDFNMRNYLAKQNPKKWC